MQLDTRRVLKFATATAAALAVTLPLAPGAAVAATGDDASITFSCGPSSYGAIVRVSAYEPNPYDPDLSVYGLPKNDEIGGKLYGQGWPSIAFTAPVGTVLTAYLRDGGPSGMGGIVTQATYTVVKC